MARLQLNKSSLAREAKDLKTYKRFLPSLDLKRQQLMAERSKAKRALLDTEQKISALALDVGDRLPMLADLNIKLDGLVTLKGIQLKFENLVGTQLPIIEQVDIETFSYSLMTLPHWVDKVAAKLREMLELKAHLAVNQRRLALLEAAVKTITQRVNLFDKVLIPKTEANIKRIKIYLSDEQMAAVVRSKIAKRKRQRAMVS